eukprot:CAMPEP_0117493792 /NCGR_PEP_ID=MMETSP0784-20121206/19278_1 /TAXON_ID=39447 /ORGANISM="" /LENGTH=352 /DNA_ID=CAMNT_0005288651 /DNA_START=74 /DNA_END=1128 /DNA_ORIENTATION=+
MSTREAQTVVASSIGSTSSSEDLDVCDSEGDGSDDVAQAGRKGGGPCRMRKLVYEFLSNDPSAHVCVQRWATLYQLAAAVLVWGLFVVDSTTEPTVTTVGYWRTELVLAIVWTSEYALRLWSIVEERVEPAMAQASACRRRWLAAMRPFQILDALSLVSLYVDLNIESNEYRGLSALRMLRLLTLYRIERDFHIFGPVFEVLKDKKDQLFATLCLAGAVLSVASVIMFYVEAPTNIEFGSVLMSMWWCTTALTTVGYGDIVPQTGGGRVVACIVAFIGTGMFGLFAGILAEGFREAYRKGKQKDKRLARNAATAAGAASVGSPSAMLDVRREVASLRSELGGLQAELSEMRG